LQTIAPSAAVASAYKDVFAFTVVIALMAWRPTGLIQEKISERSERMPEIKQEPRAPLLPGAVAVALSTVYLIALRLSKGSRSSLGLLAFGVVAVSPPLHGLARSGKPKFCRAPRVRSAHTRSSPPAWWRRSSTIIISCCCCSSPYALCRGDARIEYRIRLCRRA